MMRDDALIGHEVLTPFLCELFLKAGLDAGKAGIVARSLTDADMMGRSSHGVALAPWYLDALLRSQMTATGEPAPVTDRGACFAWDGRRLPGAWLITQAIDLCLSRVAAYGTVTASITNSFHAGALAVYLPAVAALGYMAVLTCSNPGAHWIAPFGGTVPVFSTNPIAAGIPTSGLPILLDASSSITTVNRARQLAQAGVPFPGSAPWAIDAQGNPTGDPDEVMSRGGSLLPVGGLDHGHKGYAFSLLTEALTQGLSGFGRIRPPGGAADRQVSNIYLQVIDPDAFGGGEAFRREMSWVAEACRNNKPRSGAGPVRVPGDQALRMLEQSRLQGIAVPAPVLSSLAAHAGKLSVTVPSAIDSLLSD